jgi:hypothetical protein
LPHPRPSCLLRLATLFSVTAAFCLNGILVYLMNGRGGFIFDDASAEAVVRNAHWFAQPYWWILLLAGMTLNMGYLLAVRGRWKTQHVFVGSLVNIAALFFVQTIVSYSIRHG